MYCKWGKRLFDLIISIIALIILLPFLLILAILVYWFMGSPILFIQSRPGLNERPFRLYKFRTMLNTRDSQGNLLQDDKRLTRFGKIIRSLSLDELPELINVIKGDMSLVGPRPLLMEYLPHYSTKERMRHHVRPGITGFAQINGRNALNWQKKFELDGWYVENVSFLLDIKILFNTIIKIIKREGINADGHATMSRFDQLND